MLLKIFFLLILHVSLFSNDIANLFKISFHGEFCGMDTPSLHSTTKEEEIKALQSITPIDSIDQACKDHDICYIKRGFNDKSCDKELVIEVKKIQTKLEEKKCKMLTKSIVLFFETKNKNFVTELSKSGSVDKKVINASSSSAQNIVDLATYSGELAINYSFTRPMNYIFDSDKNKDRVKDVFQALPPRKEICLEKKE